jgi:cysteinyl-tRNA synthetase
MTLRIYNSLSQKKEPFTPLYPGKVGMYVCGPTVYDSPHMGHMVGPIIFDAIKRYLVHKGLEVTWVLNITDVDDKIIQKATDLGQTTQQVAARCTQQYLDCLGQLGIDTINRFPKASEHIPEMVALIGLLIERGHAYATGGNVWFDVASDADYGKLTHRSAGTQEAGTRDLEGGGKRNPADFALWKASKPGEPVWDSPWGPGRPGWHVECSAMSMKYLGETLDIHGGGDDLKFPHHENELAQSECCTGKPFANFWLHNGLTRIRTKLVGREVNEKMSKSLGNVIGAAQFLEEHGPELLRYLILSTHYRSPIDFSEEVVAATRKGLAVFGRLFERVEGLDAPQPPQPSSTTAHESVPSELAANMHIPHFLQRRDALCRKFQESMDDDFNTAGAIAAMHELASSINGFMEGQSIDRRRQVQAVKEVKEAVGKLRALGNILGLFRVPATPHVGKQDDLVEKLMQLFIQLRQQARKDKNFALADGIRKGLTEIGVTLEDRSDGTVWRKA